MNIGIKKELWELENKVLKEVFHLKGVKDVF